MKNYYSTLTVLFFSTLLITESCSTECDNAKEYPLQNLSRYVSYTGYDTLRFLHNSTDTQVFIGEGINYFWVRKPAFDDTQCPEDHQSLSIQFRNQQNGNTIKMEYIYDEVMFYDRGTTNNKTYYKFYRNGVFLGEELDMYNTSPTIINGFDYSIVFIFSAIKDTSQYLMYRRPYDGGFGGIVKIKQIGDTLTLIK
jgi:hypothetical protein